MNGNASNYTDKLGLSQFLASDKPSWLTDYNNDMQKIDQMVDAPEATAVVENGRLKITSTIPRLSNSYAVQFIARFTHNSEMPVEIDGTPVSLFDSDGRPVQNGWKEGDFVHIQRMGQAARILSPLLNKANKGLSFGDITLNAAASITAAHSCYCWRNEVGEVGGRFGIVGPITPGIIVGWLPAGFRPRAGYAKIVLVFTDGGNKVLSPTTMEITTDGKIIILYQTTSNGFILSDFYFAA